MNKIVYLTYKRFDFISKDFVKSLAEELRNRNVEVVTDSSFDVLNCLRRHKTYGIAIAVDLYRNGKEGSGLTLNKDCSSISRDFAYNISNAYDIKTPLIRWRNFEFVDSYDKEWYRFFNRISSRTKAIFHLFTFTNSTERNEFYVVYKDVVKLFVDEIVRCLRSEYNDDDYRMRVMRVKSSKMI